MENEREETTVTTEKKLTFVGEFVELKEWFESALVRTLMKNDVLTQQQKETFADVYESELDNGDGFTLYELEIPYKN